MNKKTHEPIIHLVKRVEVNQKQAWGIRIGAFLLSILVCAIVSTILSGRSMGFFFTNFFKGIFGTERRIWNLLHETAIILLIALAVTPCFKMKFWNIGGEGQVLMGALGCAVIISQMGGEYSDAATIVTSLVLSIAFGIVWAAIPALFKAKWNTNETLLTLMMNYIAVCIVNYFIKKVDPKGTGNLTFSEGVIGEIGGNEFILKIIIVVIITAIMGVYLKYTKHGYELTVVGESENTARYIGINTKKVIIRTLILCGVLCGIAGFLLVSATNHGIGSSSTVGGRGFTGVMISWLGHFNPLGIALASFIYVFFSRGAVQVGNLGRLGSSFPDIICGIFLFIIIASEFFINYQVKFRNGEKIREFFMPVIKVFEKMKPNKEKSGKKDNKEQTEVEAAEITDENTDGNKEETVTENEEKEERENGEGITAIPSEESETETIKVEK